MMEMHTSWPSHTLYTLGFYSYSVPENISREAGILICTPSVWLMFNFSSNPVALEHTTHPCPITGDPPSWRSPSNTRRTQSAGSPSDMDALDNYTPAPCTASFPGLNTYAHKALSPTTPSALSRRDIYGATSPAQRSCQPSAPPAPEWGVPWDYSPEKYPPGPSRQAAPWCYFSETLKPTPSGSLGGDAAIKYCATSMSWRLPLFRGTPRPWSLLGIISSYQRRHFNPHLSEHLLGDGGLL